MKKRRAICWAITAPLLAAAFLFWWLPAGYDPALVDARLRSLKAPYRSVQSSYFLDGGSVGVAIVDAEGREMLFASPSHLGEPDRHTRLFVGAIYDRHAGAEEISEPEHTRRMLARILRDKSERSREDALALFAFEGRVSDLLWQKVREWME